MPSDHPRSMHLMLFFSPFGRAHSAWRQPDSPVEDLFGLELPARLARQLEDAKFDAVFIPDQDNGFRPNFEHAPVSCPYETVTMMAALAARTQRIGLVATVSTTFVAPYHLARYMASIDHMSGGRAGWNIVTSTGGEDHYGMQLPPKDERYNLAGEYLEVVKGLWDSWDDDAVICDRAGGVWADTSKIRATRFQTEHYDVQGPMAVPRSPQGWPVLVQAGQSEAGVRFAAKNAEVVFTAQSHIDSAREFYARVKGLAVEYGRDPDQIKVLPGLAPIIAGSAAEAQRISDEFSQFIDFEREVAAMAKGLHARLDDLELDEPIPPERLTTPADAAAAGWASSRYSNNYELAVRDRLTIRQLLIRRDQSPAHFTVTGSASHVADQMTEWVSTGAADGFCMLPVTIPESQDAICGKLVPELQSRGSFRADYTGSTLREHLGLPRPQLQRRSEPLLSGTTAAGR